MRFSTDHQNMNIKMCIQKKVDQKYWQYKQYMAYIYQNLWQKQYAFKKGTIMAKKNQYK